jgi:hypothetical protein
MVPNTLPDGFLWRLLIVGNTNEDEQIWCRTYINDCAGCGGWLARQGGAAAQQQWYSGRYPYTHVPLSGVRLVDASPIGALGATTAMEISQEDKAKNSSQLHETIAELTETMRNMREENKSMFHAMSERADTDANAARSNEDMTNQRCLSTLREGSYTSRVARRRRPKSARRASHIRARCASCNDAYTSDRTPRYGTTFSGYIEGGEQLSLARAYFL